MPRRPKIARTLGASIIEDSKLNSHSPSRRNFLTHSAMLTAAGLLGAWQVGCKTQTIPKIAILGGGLAGLTAAYYLGKAGLNPVIYESDNRAGGRIVSRKNWIAPGITTELGGEFIDSNHTDILKFCREFGLPLLDMQAAGEEKLIGTDFFFRGRRIGEREIIDAFRPFSKVIQADIASFPGLDRMHPKVREFDAMSIDTYLEKIGVSDWLFDILTTSFTSELGLQSAEQSSLNLLSVLNTDTSSGFAIYGESDERYKIAGGNEQLIGELQKRLKSEILTGYHVESITEAGSYYQLHFSNGKHAKFDYLIVTLPFSVLRNVDFRVPISDIKRRCIDELGYGMQSKMFIGMKDRVWRKTGFSGYVLSDRIHNGWDSSQMQNDNDGEGVYSLFLGAEKGRDLNVQQYDSYLDSCDMIFPSMRQHASGKRDVVNWTKNTRSSGAYACYKVGQVSAFGGEEGKREKNILFAGEHCSPHFQGFMNGAAETGRMAAESIAVSLLK
jgi:monoamine oxidase